MAMNQWGKSAWLLLAAGLAACSDGGAGERAQAEAKAQADAAAKQRKLQEDVAHNVGCLSALRWQRATVAGDVKPYQDFYQAKLEQALGGEILAKGADGAPTLSRSNTYDYVQWAYPRDVETRFRAGKDKDGDGKVSEEERSGKGLDMVVQCVQFAAEMGQGPLARQDNIARMTSLQGVRKRLRDKPA